MLITRLDEMDDKVEMKQLSDVCQPRATPPTPLIKRGTQKIGCSSEGGADARNLKSRCNAMN